MKYTHEEISTDQLVNLIVTEVGAPIPHYDYETNQYISVLPQIVIHNITKGFFGIKELPGQDTFRKACIEVLKWNDEYKDCKNKTV